MRVPGKCKLSVRTWTVLIYANGNNEMEPEIYRGMQAIRPNYTPNNVNVIIQWARAPQQLVKIFRRQISNPPTEQWNGARRYIISQTGITPVAEIGPVNMADPCTLADFLIWGITNYPSDYIMIILSGHGAGFTGILTDYTQPSPVIMSIAGLTGALQHCRQITGKHCDILAIDACFMNMIEIWYELALMPYRPVRFLLTPLGDASMECLPYHVIISELRTGFKRRLQVQLLTDIVTAVNRADKNSGDILAVDLAPANFIQLKNIIDQLSGLIIKNNLNLATILGDEYRKSVYYPLISLQKLNDRLIACPDNNFPDGLLATVLNSILSVPSYVTRYKPNDFNANIFLPVAPNLYSYYAADYEQLLFTAGNRWLHVLQGSETIDYAAAPCPNPNQALPPPVPMSINSVAYSLQSQNPNLTDEQAWQILKELNWYK